MQKRNLCSVLLNVCEHRMNPPSPGPDLWWRIAFSKSFFVWVDRSIGIGIGRKAFPSPWYHLWTSFGSFELIVLTAVQEREAQSLGAGERIIHQFAIISMDNGYGNGKMTTLTGKKKIPSFNCSSFTTLKEKGDLTLPRLPSTWLGPAARASALTWWWSI